MDKGKLKAYIVSDKWREYSTIEFAQSAGKAKSNALYKDIFDGYWYTQLRTERIKDFDKYAESKKVPIQELLKRCWWFGCIKCGKQPLDQEDISEGTAHIYKDGEDACEFAKGAVICAECKKKLEECGHVV